MFQNVRAVLHDTLKSINKLVFAFQIIVQIGFIAYLAYSSFANFSSQNWLWIPKAILLLISTAYFIFYLVIEKDGLSKEEKKTKKQIDLWKKRFSFVTNMLIIKPATVVTSVYTIVLQGEDASMLSLLATCVMILGWAFSVLLEIFRAIIAARVALFEEAWEADLEPFTNVIHAPGRIIQKLTGKPAEEEKKPSRRRLHLGRLVETMKKDKAEKKEKKKEAKAKERAIRQEAKVKEKKKQKESLPTK